MRKLIDNKIFINISKIIVCGVMLGLLVFTIYDRNESIEEQNKENENLSINLKKCNKENKEINKKYEELKKQLNEKENEINGLKEQISQKDNEITRLKN